jgi:hypothetical protein
MAFLTFNGITERGQWLPYFFSPLRSLRPFAAATSVFFRG